MYIKSIIDNKIFLFSIINILMTIVSILEDNIAIFFIVELFLILGIISIIFIFQKLNNSNSIILFLQFFIIYFIIMYLGHYLVILSGLNYFSPDEEHFFNVSNSIVFYLNADYSILDIAKIYNYHESPAQAYISGYIAIIANYFGTNSIIIQKTLVVFFAALIPSTIYNIFTHFINDKISVKAAIYYGLFSFIVFFSFRLLRDITIAELFLLVIYLTLRKLSIKNVILLSLLITISILMRYETGIYLVGYLTLILLVYLYKTNLSLTLKWFIILIPIIAVIFSAIYYLDVFNYMAEFSKANLERITAQASSDSIGMKLRTLPYGLNYIATTIFSQISPLPPWLHIELNELFLLYFFEFIATISWFYVWSFVIIPLFFFKLWLGIDFRIKFLFLYSLLYIILISSIEAEVRRMMAVYPMIYLIAVINYNNISSNRKKYIFLISTFIYLLILVSYTILRIK